MAAPAVIRDISDMQRSTVSYSGIAERLDLINNVLCEARLDGIALTLGLTLAGKRWLVRRLSSCTHTILLSLLPCY